MEVINDIYLEIKPILATFIFELKKQWKKFIIFSIVSSAFVILLSYLPYALIPDNSLPTSQAEFFQDSLQFLNEITIFASCFFFGGIICSEFSKKTGHIIFPIINKYKILLGKFLGSLTMVIGVLASFYFTMVFLGVYFYGGPLNIRIVYSFGIALLYILALCGFVTCFSSFMKNVNITIISCILLLLIANMIVDQLVVLWIPDFEPMYSLNHMSKLISYILESDFPTELADRYKDETISQRQRGAASEFTVRIWYTPSIIGGIFIALSYAIICLIIALIIFSKRQL